MRSLTLMTVMSKSQRSALARAVAAGRPLIRVSAIELSSSPVTQAARDISGQRLAAIVCDPVKADRQVARPPSPAPHRHCCRSGKPSGTENRTPSTGVKELGAADIAFIGAVAEQEPVDAVEIEIAAAIADPFRSESPCMVLGKFDALAAHWGGLPESRGSHQRRVQRPKSAGWRSWSQGTALPRRDRSPPRPAS